MGSEKVTYIHCILYRPIYNLCTFFQHIGTGWVLCIWDSSKRFRNCASSKNKNEHRVPFKRYHALGTIHIFVSAPIIYVSFSPLSPLQVHSVFGEGWSWSGCLAAILLGTPRGLRDAHPSTSRAGFLQKAAVLSKRHQSLNSRRCQSRWRRQQMQKPKKGGKTGLYVDSFLR